MNLPVVSNAFGTVSDWLSVQKKTTPPTPTPSIAEKVVVSISRVFYAFVDALDRIRSSSDGLDKSLKLLSGLSVGMMMMPTASRDFWSGMSKEFKYIDGVFSAFAVFGRYNEFIKVDDKGSPIFLKGKGVEASLKNANVAFLAASKTFEFGRLLNTCGLMSTQALVQADVNYLGGALARIGGSSVLGKVAWQAGLAGCKDFFLVVACAFSVVNNTLTIINWKQDTFGLSRAGISIGADLGKVYLATAVFTVSCMWVTVAILTAVLGLSKILMDSYRASSNKNGEMIAYPNWMSPAWVKA